MNTYTIDYLDSNGYDTFVSIDAYSKDSAQVIFHNTYGEQLKVIAIHLEQEAA